MDLQKREDELRARETNLRTGEQWNFQDNDKREIEWDRLRNYGLTDETSVDCSVERCGRCQETDVVNSQTKMKEIHQSRRHP